MRKGCFAVILSLSLCSVVESVRVNTAVDIVDTDSTVLSASLSSTNRTRPNNTTRYPTPLPGGAPGSGPAAPGLPPRGDMTKCPSQCNGHGLACVPQPYGDSVCLCHAGFSGDECQFWTGCSDRSFCTGHGSCACGLTSCSCKCMLGWDGNDCSVSLPSHCPNHCSGRGVCVPGEKGGYGCVCDEGYAGDDCGHVKEDMCNSECSGQGSCDMPVHKCDCSGANGTSCEVALDTCGGCIHGTCTAGACACFDGYSGAHCDVYQVQSDPCSTVGYCSGRGVCSEGADSSASCVCQEGFAGLTCNQLLASVSDLCPNYCSGHGVCDEVAKACVCAGGYGGSDCSAPPCAADNNGVMCGGHGICASNDTSQTYLCDCDPCYSGSQCEVNAVEQCQGLCGGNGDCLCQSVGATSEAVCSCHDGWEGAMCDIRSLSTGAPECCPLDCSGQGTCVSCVCQCGTGWTGDDCATSSEAPSTITPADGADSLDNLSQLLEFGEGSDSGVAEVRRAVVVDSAKWSMSHLWD